ncbi:tyrosine-type recombinase/integrase [Celeribacter halophilus]|uniref:Phage integrase family protein n=1 Tax=Celeribacter halophilus TaxID=576117 RepID=A0A1I3V6W2_9RHOB|nr:tyrosine-type recombinase/integrase [Celeribacter halophilus]PZX09558.1 phage integrase family protein [Celeribacter halophilus]SFJ91284.1 Phage integrase family protein [Celeribacter halophilus]
MTKKLSTLPRARSTWRKTAHHADINIYDDVWVLRNEGQRDSLNFGLLTELVSPEFEFEIRHVFAKLVAVYVASTSVTYFNAFLALLRSSQNTPKCDLSIIDGELVALWMNSSPSAARVLQLKGLFKAWRRFHGTFVEDEAFDLINRLNIPTNSGVYSTVLTWDENDGPYRPSEDEAIRVALDDAFNEGKLNLDEYSMFRVLRGTGARLSSIADLKVGDLRHEEGRSYIKIPMKKQRGIAGWREAFMPWKPVTQGLSNILAMQIETNVTPRLAPEEDRNQAPIFPSKRAKDLSSPHGHRSISTLKKTYGKVMERLEVVSPVTGHVIHGNPRRDRHTFLTMLALRGCSAEEIAANAGHINVTSCQAYVDASIDHFQRMEKLVGAAFIPVADRFIGTVSESHNDPNSEEAIWSE